MVRKRIFPKPIWHPGNYFGSVCPSSFVAKWKLSTWKWWCLWMCILTQNLGVSWGCWRIWMNFLRTSAVHQTHLWIQRINVSCGKLGIVMDGVWNQLDCMISKNYSDIRNSFAILSIAWIVFQYAWIYIFGTGYQIMLF